MAKKTPPPSAKKSVTPVKKAAASKSPQKAPPATKKTSSKPSKTPPAKKEVKAAKPAKSSTAKPAAKTTSPKKASVPPLGTKPVSSLKKVSHPPKTPSAPKDTTAKAETKPKSTSVSSPGNSKPAAKTTKKAAARDALRSRVLGRAKSTKSIAFSLDEVKEIAKTSAKKEEAEATTKASKTAEKKAAIEASLASAKPTRVAAASLADILGFNPAAGKKVVYDDPELVPEKFRRYYKLLLELRSHLTGQIDQHSEDTLKRSAKDDAGDLSSYGQHMADAGTDTFDRDFALSLVANEQEALSEIEAAIQRIKSGNYGNCEVTGKPIAKERLLAVPFTRYSAEAQKQIERNSHRVRTQAGLFGEMGEDGPTMADTSDDD